MMVKDQMKRAVDACARAGIGLTAMKTQAAFLANLYATIGSKTDEALKMTENFMNKGYTVEQAKLKAVWENPNIASICSAMPNMTILQANVAAAKNKTNLSDIDKRRLELYAQQTAPGYCAGCAHICETAINNKVPISKVMRCLMYDRSYGDPEKATALFKKIPIQVQKRLGNLEYENAERKCPQRIQIGRLMREAASEYHCKSSPSSSYRTVV
jgi:predicted aldo/keto reductase-like oxidoreductase